MFEEITSIISSLVSHQLANGFALDLPGGLLNQATTNAPKPQTVNPGVATGAVTGLYK